MKKIISILLISLLTLGLVACGDTSQNKRVDENPAVEESNKSTEETDAGSGNWLEGKRFSAQVSENELKDWIGNLP